jgi:flagellar basal-body rod protein FlgB
MDKNFNVLHKILQATSERQKVLASNVANAETPGYKGKDIKFDSFIKKEMKLLTTNSGHMRNNSGSGIDGKIETTENPSWGDRNNVELNVEVGKMQENLLTHNAAIKILNSQIKMYKNAITGRR